MHEEISAVVSLDTVENTRIVQTRIAEQFLRIHGDKAYMLILMEIEDASLEMRRQNWREILAIMEQLEKEKQNVDGKL